MYPNNPSQASSASSSASVASAGAGVVVYSSDLDEVLALATRILVVHGGVVSETARDRETVGRAMLGIA